MAGGGGGRTFVKILGGGKGTVEIEVEAMAICSRCGARRVDILWGFEGRGSYLVSVYVSRLKVVRSRHVARRGRSIKDHQVTPHSGILELTAAREGRSQGSGLPPTRRQDALDDDRTGVFFEPVRASFLSNRAELQKRRGHSVERSTTSNETTTQRRAKRQR